MVGQARLGDGRHTQLGAVCELVKIHRPKEVGKLMWFLQATNWMRFSLHHRAEIMILLSALMERNKQNAWHYHGLKQMVIGHPNEWKAGTILVII